MRIQMGLHESIEGDLKQSLIGKTKDEIKTTLQSLGYRVGRSGVATGEYNNGGTRFYKVTKDKSTRYIIVEFGYDYNKGIHRVSVVRDPKSGDLPRYVEVT